MTATQRREMVIGWGNPSRRDDAVGHHVLDALDAILAPSSSTHRPVLVKAHQLDITLAQAVASQDLVIFVDASVAPDTSEPVNVQPLAAEPSRPPQATTHSLTPVELLAMTQWVYSRVPHAMLVTVKGHDFSFGEGLSAPAQSAVAEATRAVVELLGTSTD